MARIRGRARTLAHDRARVYGYGHGQGLGLGMCWVGLASAGLDWVGIVMG